MNAPSSDTAAIRQTILALIGAGWAPDAVHDGEERVPVRTEREAIEAITAVDDAHLIVYHGTAGTAGWVRFVLGNDPKEVICDHTTNLSPVLDELTEGWSQR